MQLTLLTLAIPLLHMSLSLLLLKHQTKQHEQRILAISLTYNINMSVGKVSLWAHTVVYALFKHYDLILLKYYFVICFVDFFWYHFNITMVILDPQKSPQNIINNNVYKIYHRNIEKILKKYTRAHWDVLGIWND